MKRLTIADLDSVIYIVAYNNTETKDPQKVIDAVTEYIDKIVEDTEAEAFVGYYQKEGHKNYRNKLFSGYKANRKIKAWDKWDKTISDILTKIRKKDLDLTDKTVKAGLIIKDLVEKYTKIKEEEAKKAKQWLTVIHNCMDQYPGVIGLTTIESDDAVSIMYYTHKDTYDITLSHIDKDINNIPGRHQNYKDNSYYNITKEQAEFLFNTQVLTGDTGDGLPGLHGIGPTAAKKFVTTSESLTAAYGKAATRDYHRDYHCIRLLKNIDELEKLGKFKEVEFDIIEDFSYANEDFD